MTTLQVLKSSLMLPAGRRVDGFSTRKRRWICRDERGFKGMLRPRGSAGKRVRIFCAAQGDGSSGNGEEPPESLFMKELRRRGMTPTSLLEESKRGAIEVDQDPKSKHKNGGVSMRSTVSTNFEQNLSDQRERSMSLNSEGLEGLIPRAKLLLTLGGTFFLAFRPLILATIAIFSALYFYFGTSFLHDGTDKHAALSQYVDPYTLVEDGRITQTQIN
uniref:Uncharacterized protein n=1 Tax=Kalanchoe fedtschenkoi TaxID=63787 RepID=A0A7N0UEA2_KALFE